MLTHCHSDGRTETVRPVSNQSCAFVRAIEDPSATDKERSALFLKYANVRV